MTVPTEEDEAFIVTVGKDHRRRMFYCFVNADATHWVFLDTDGHEHRGPAFEPIDHEMQLQRLVADWWSGQPASGLPVRDLRLVED